METKLTIEEADTIYAALLKAHEGLSEADSQALNSRLILLMADEIGSCEAVQRLINVAKSS